MDIFNFDLELGNIHKICILCGSLSEEGKLYTFDKETNKIICKWFPDEYKQIESKIINVNKINYESSMEDIYHNTLAYLFYNCPTNTLSCIDGTYFEKKNDIIIISHI